MVILYLNLSIPLSPFSHVFQSVMDLIEAVSSRATSLCSDCKEVKGNKKQCQRLAERVKGLEELLKLKGAGQSSDAVEEALHDLCDLIKTLQFAAEVVEKYTSDSFQEHMIKDYYDNTEFVNLNSRLYDAFYKLSQALQVDHEHKLHKLFNKASQQEEDEADRKEDHAELKRSKRRGLLL